MWVLIIYLFFLPVMLPSEVPRLATDSAISIYAKYIILHNFIISGFWFYMLAR